MWRDVLYDGRASFNNVCTGCTDNPITLGADEYFVLGDNSTNAYDSRMWPPAAARYQGVQQGAVPKRAIIGVAKMTYWPLNRLRIYE